MKNVFIEPGQRFLAVSRALAKLDGLETFLQGEVIDGSGWFRKAANIDAVLAWGRKPSAKKAELVALDKNLPLLRVEDAFLRSVELGAYSRPYGVVLDNIGIYYDASKPSRLEELIQKPLSEKEAKRTQTLIDLWRKERVSKYNHCRDEDFSTAGSYVVVIDQTFGDASIQFGLAEADSFIVMLNDAMARYPAHKIIVKTHPDVIAGLKQGHYSNCKQLNDSRVILEGRSVHTPSLLEYADAVFCVTSQVGFEALLWGKRVFTYGVPFYSGWGLTTDHTKTPERRKRVSLEQLVHAALIGYGRYCHPETGKLCSVEELITWMGLQRRLRSEFPAKLLCERFPRWKRARLRQFFAGSELSFLKKNEPLPTDKKVVVWGRNPAANCLRVEDGFIRSVGLGADLTAPKSWVIDDKGMYYDASQPSKLELLLQTKQFSEHDLQRAERLKDALIQQKVSKYNVGQSTWKRPANEKEVVLVPGQVESDASVQFGSPELKSNFALLSAVRERCPDAYIVYKPHPDVVAGLRVKDQQAERIKSLCDEVLIDEDMASLLEKVDSVHTLTSLTGFEALLRGVAVTCYGQPFYSGWGLTTDAYPNSRRTTKRSLNELVAATLLYYPRYISSRSGTLSTPEQIMKEIVEEKSRKREENSFSRKLKRMLLRLKRF